MRTLVVVTGLGAGLALLLAGCEGTGNRTYPPQFPTVPPTATVPGQPANTPTTAPTATTPAHPSPVASATASSGGNAAHGQQLVAQNGCTACHSINGSAGVGPTWKGLYGSTVTLTTGATVVADDAYIHESIVDPNAKIVKGFVPNIMPQTFGQSLSSQDIQDIIAYIKTLK